MRGCGVVRGGASPGTHVLRTRTAGAPLLPRRRREHKGGLLQAANFALLLAQVDRFRVRGARAPAAPPTVLFLRARDQDPVVRGLEAAVLAGLAPDEPHRLWALLGAGGAPAPVLLGVGDSSKSTDSESPHAPWLHLLMQGRKLKMGVGRCCSVYYYMYYQVLARSTAVVLLYYYSSTLQSTVCTQHSAQCTGQRSDKTNQYHSSSSSELLRRAVVVLLLLGSTLHATLLYSTLVYSLCWAGL